MRRNKFIAMALLAICIGSVHAQTFPSRPVHIVVPFGPGSSADQLARLFSEPFAKALGQSVVVENRPGAGGNIGTLQVINAPADGYALSLGGTGTLAINRELYGKNGFDALKSLAPLVHLGFSPTVLVVNAKSPYQTLGDLLQAAKRQPGKISFGSPGNGTTGHISSESLKQRSGADMTHVPYREATQALTAILGGQIDFLMYHPGSVMTYVRSGQLRALGVSSERRSPSAPEVPTIAEQGFPGFDMVAWATVMAQRAAPEQTLSTLKRAAEAAARDPAVVEGLRRMGFEPLPPGTDLEAYLRAEEAKWGRLVKASGASVD